MTNKEKHQERFIQKSRFKARVKKLRYLSSEYTSGIASARLEGMAYHTRALCSCPMCGNSRTHFGEVTVQEKSSAELYNLLKDFKDEE